MRRLNSGIWRADGVSKSSSGRCVLRSVNREGSARHWRVGSYSSLSEFAAPQETPHSAVALVEPQVRPTFEGADVVLTLRLPVPLSTLRFVRYTEARPRWGRVGNLRTLADIGTALRGIASGI